MPRAKFLNENGASWYLAWVEALVGGLEIEAFGIELEGAALRSQALWFGVEDDAKLGCGRMAGNLR